VFRYGKIQSVKLFLIPLQSGDDGASEESQAATQSAVVAFMDIKCASKAHEVDNVLDGVKVVTQFNESSTGITAKLATQFEQVRGLPNISPAEHFPGGVEKTRSNEG